MVLVVQDQAMRCSAVQPCAASKNVQMKDFTFIVIVSKMSVSKAMHMSVSWHVPKNELE